MSGAATVDDPRVVLVTAPDEATGLMLARSVVEARLAACVNLVPAVRSVFRWEGSIQEAAEVLLILKTTAARVETLRERVVSLHPYEVPEFVVLAVDGGLDAYLAWIRTEVSPNDR